MSPRWTRRWQIALIVTLMAFYAVVMAGVLRPRVEPAYLDYYVHRTSTVPPAQLARLAPLPLGQAQAPDDASPLAFDGWSHAEATHRWTAARSARLHLRVGEAAAAQSAHQLTLRVMALPGQTVGLAWNDCVLDDWAPATEDVLHVTLAPGCVRPGVNTLSLALPDARQPGNGDTRLLAVALRALTLAAAPWGRVNTP